jgi:threonine dehydrogenase-like Zn-dependent dehydrogenase
MAHEISTATMRAVVYNGTAYQVSTEDIAKSVITCQTDVIVRVTTAAICGSDLHIYRGFMGGVPPWTMGHEAIGYISEVGSAVSSFAVGDYVVIPDTVSTDQLQLEPASAPYFGFGSGEAWAEGLQGA